MPRPAPSRRADDRRPHGQPAGGHRSGSTIAGRLLATTGTAALALGLAAARNARRNAEVVRNVAPDLRPWVAVLPPSLLTADRSGAPARGSLSERVLSAAMPRGLGRAITLPGRDGGPDVPAFVYEAPGRRPGSGAVLWIHGGGMIVGGPWMDHSVCTRMARELGVLVVSVDYRLAPEDPFPAGPEDCCAALAWLHDSADSLGIDPGRIAVGGESAGGGLAAMVAQMASDRGLAVAFQALAYPMLDDRTVLADRGAEVGRLVWTPQSNTSAWEAFHGRAASLVEDRPYAAAARRSDLTGLPPAWIGVGTIDLFHDEDVDYAHRLRDAGVAVELHVVEGMPHAADTLQWVPSMRAFRTSMITAIGRAVGAR